MYKNHSFITIIPARGGSKRVPQKNKRPLCGKPLVVWTIEAAFQSQYIDKVVVSSDDKEILAIAQQAGAETIMRPEKLASDTATAIDTVMHTLSKIKRPYDYTVLLQPTSPLRTGRHIDEAIQILFKRKAKAVISVTEMDHPPLWANTLPADGNMQGFLREDVINKRSQDLEKFYRVNGALYICNTKELQKEKRFFLTDSTFAYIMRRTNSVDIDEEIDFLLAEAIMKSRGDQCQ